MIELEFTKTASYGGSTFYKSNIVEVHPVYYWGRYAVYTDYVVAFFNYKNSFATDKKEWGGYQLGRRVKGTSKASIKEAQDWLNFLVNYPPQSYFETKGE